ncbi:hypothetical protein EWB00_011125 [Schistosoma japonicum]|uniref:Uncharacterized protein n=1 Tax=Schistosoma japonicum TaxID=6182 RepID=A0A4Z2DLX6_SCHJA|nr:hypothetical protein EWB00_011125 [Schistosoma japonicum]
MIAVSNSKELLNYHKSFRKHSLNSYFNFISNETPTIQCTVTVWHTTIKSMKMVCRQK